ncbi:hypothetical protein C8T65DRAFT_545061, partial [Cerioporus squamosus]
EHFILATLLLVTVMHALAEAAQVDVAFVLTGVKAILFGAFMWLNSSLGRRPSLTDAQNDMLKAIPSDIRAILKKLDLEPAIIRYAVC